MWLSNTANKNSDLIEVHSLRFGVSVDVVAVLVRGQCCNALNDYQGCRIYIDQILGEFACFFQSLKTTKLFLFWIALSHVCDIYFSISFWIALSHVCDIYLSILFAILTLFLSIFPLVLIFCLIQCFHLFQCFAALRNTEISENIRTK